MTAQKAASVGRKEHMTPTVLKWMLAISCLGLALPFGCERGGDAAPSVRDQLSMAKDPPTKATAEPPPARTEPAPATPKTVSSRPIALVNGSPIERQDLVNLLIETRGLSQLQQLVLAEVARQETRRQGLDVSNADIENEYEHTLQADRFNGRDPDKLTPARREQLIDEWITSRGITRRELEIAIERQAHLRRLAEREVTITEEALREEFRIKHGERVEVRHIQIAAPRIWPRIKKRLDAGEDFEKLVRDFSENVISREKGGLLPPFAVKDDPTVPPEFATLASQLQPGEVSNPVEAEGRYHILQLVRRIPPDEQSFEELRPLLERHLHARLVAQKMEALGERLLMQARIDIKDATLRRQYEERRTARQIVGPRLQSE